MFYCLVVGSRSFNDYNLLATKLDFLLQNYAPEITIVSGAAHGADTLARWYAKAKSYKLIEFPADWELLGMRAGYLRNIEMHKFIAQFEHRACIAFWDGQSKGTQHNFNIASVYQNPLRIIRF